MYYFSGRECQNFDGGRGMVYHVKVNVNIH